MQSIMKINRGMRLLQVFFFFFANVFDVCLLLGGGGDCPQKPKNNFVHASNQSPTTILSTREWSVTWH